MLRRRRLRCWGLRRKVIARVGFRRTPDLGAPMAAPCERLQTFRSRLSPWVGGGLAVDLFNYVTTQDYSGRDGRGGVRLDIGPRRLYGRPARRRFRHGAGRGAGAPPSDGRSRRRPASGVGCLSTSGDSRTRPGGPFYPRRQVPEHALQAHGHADASAPALAGGADRRLQFRGGLSGQGRPRRSGRHQLSGEDSAAHAALYLRRHAGWR